MEFLIVFLVGVFSGCVYMRSKCQSPDDEARFEKLRKQHRTSYLGKERPFTKEEFDAHHPGLRERVRNAREIIRTFEEMGKDNPPTSANNWKI